MWKKTFWILLIFISILFIPILKNRNEKLFRKEGVATNCKIIEIKRWGKGITTHEILAQVEYFIGDSTVYTKVPSRKEYKVGECYKLEYLKSNITFVRMGEQIPCK